MKNYRINRRWDAFLLSAVSAFLLAVFSACSNDEAVTPSEPKSEPGKIHVTVGAGLGNAETRSQVVKDGSTRTLTFSEGDKLYIVGNFEEQVGMFEVYEYRMGGYLSLVSGAGTTNATFSGDLTVWELTGNIPTEVPNFANTHNGNPMDWFGDNTVNATLIHNGIKEGIFSYVEETKEYSFDYSPCIVTGQTDNVSTLMEKALHVRGTYDPTAGSFSLACGDPIFNCNFTIDGLSANTNYYVRIKKGDDMTSFTPNNYLDQCIIRSDGSGYVHFACTTPLSGEGNWQIQLCANSDFGGTIFTRDIGQKTLGAKVYNVGNAPDPGNDPGNNPEPATDVVSLSDVTSAYIGNIIGTDGSVYPYNAAMPDGVGKAAMICYIPEKGHGLAIELNSNPQECGFEAGSMPSGINGGSWRTPSRDDWRNMVNGCGSVETFLNKYNATDVTFKTTYTDDFYGTGLQDYPTSYWTSESYYKRESDAYGPEGEYAYCLDISNGQLSFPSTSLEFDSSGYFHLACFAF